MTSDLRNKRVLVVGAAGGIGAATARAFFVAGAHVLAASRRSSRLDAIAKEIGSDPIALDILDNDAIEAFFAAAEPFDHIVITAADTEIGSVADLSLDAAKAAMESKFWGAYRVARAAKVVEGGSITFVSGAYARRPAAGAALQGAINSALEALGLGLALERSPVRTNTVSPGLIDTPMWDHMQDADREEMFARAANRLPAGRVGQPKDVAEAVLFVATNPFVTGSVVTVDGGATIA